MFLPWKQFEEVKYLTRADALRIQPVEELKALRPNPCELKNIRITANSESKVSDIQGDCFELDMTIDPGKRVKMV